MHPPYCKRQPLRQPRNTLCCVAFSKTSALHGAHLLRLLCCSCSAVCCRRCWFISCHSRCCRCCSCLGLCCSSRRKLWRQHLQDTPRPGFTQQALAAAWPGRIPAAGKWTRAAPYAWEQQSHPNVNRHFTYCQPGTAANASYPDQRGTSTSQLQ
jgi:hypothetical protein